MTVNIRYANKVTSRKIPRERFNAVEMLFLNFYLLLSILLEEVIWEIKILRSYRFATISA